MRRIPGSALVFGLSLGLLFMVALGPGLRGTPSAAAADPETIARGQYLANTTCVECHTPRVEGDPYRLDQAKLFAGGEQYEGPWGVVYAKNITADVETGIGAWTEAELKRAITEGIARDGTKLVLMPWQIFRGLSDADVSALAAYLKTVPAVKHQVPTARLAPPEAVAGFVNSIPPLKAAVSPDLFSDPRAVFHDFVSATAPAASTLAPPSFTAPQGPGPARGEYLVGNLLGCRDCHTTNLAGGAPPFFAPNITPDQETGIGAWSEADLTKALKTGYRPDGRRLAPVMPAGDLAYGRLTDEDLASVVAYLKSVAPVRKAAAPPPGPPPSPPDAQASPPQDKPATLPKTGGPLSPDILVVALTVLGMSALGVGLRLVVRHRP
ncbi:MAG: cytochrome c [Chloroflexi bacterium]|nr:cytochrome c [Chloroflexota bacterium]